MCMVMKYLISVICWTTANILSASHTIIMGKSCLAGCSGQGLSAFYGACVCHCAVLCYMVWCIARLSCRFVLGVSYVLSNPWVAQSLLLV